MPDIFDQVSAPAPQGDIFDQVSAKPYQMPNAAQLQAAAGSPMGRALAQANAVEAKGLTPIEQASNTYQLQHPANMPTANPFVNAAQGAFNSFDPLANALIRTGNRAGLIPDQRAQEAMAYQPFAPANPTATSALIGSGIGQAAQLGAVGPFAPGVAAINAGEQEREQLDARLAAGEQISGARQAGDVLGQSGLAAGLTALAPGGKATKSIIGAAGKLENPLLNAGRNLAVGAGAGLTENVGQQLGGNVIRRTVGGDQNQELTEGVNEAAKAGLVFGGVGHAAHEAPSLFARLRAERAAEQGAEHPTAPRQEPQHIEEQQPQQGNESEQRPAQQVSQVHVPENRQEPAKTEEAHPARLADEKALTEWYKRTNPNDQTGDLIGTMAPHIPYALAEVPADFAKPLTGGGDIDQEKVNSLKNLTDEEHAKLAPGILGLNGEVFDGNHRAIAAQEAGRSFKAYVPESLIGQHGIEAAGTAPEQNVNPSEQVPTKETGGTTLSKFMAGKPESLPQGPRLRGGNRAGAMALPAHADVYGPGSIYHEEVRPQLQKVANAAREIKEGLKSMFPVETGAGHEEAQNIFREQFNRAANAHAALEDHFENARMAFDKMGLAANRDFMRRMYNVEAQPTPELQKLADAMYADTNEGRKELVALGHDAAASWDQQKWNMLWKKDSKAAAEYKAIAGTPNRPGRIEGKAGFLKGQKLADFDEGIAKGLVPKYDNPVEMFLATKAERSKYIAGVRGMEQLVRNDQVMRAELDDGQPVIPEGWSEVPSSAKGPLKNLLAKKYPDLEGKAPLIAPDGVNRILRNITTPSALGNKAAFRLLMDANNTITQSMLGLSGFHIKKVSQELINLSVARAVDLALAGDKEAVKTAAQAVSSPFKAIMNGGEIQKMMLGQLKPQTADQARVIDAMKTQFKARPDKEYETQWGRKFQKAIDQGGLQGMIRAGMHAAPALNERLMQQGVFGFVQRAKLHMGSELVGDYLRKNPNATQAELVKETGKISDHLDNVLGLMNRDNLFWNRTARDLATLGTLSVGWNYGSFRALGGGLVDLGKGLGSLAKGGKVSDIDTRRISYLATTAALTGLTGAALTYMATGKAPQGLRDYVFPPTGGKDREGHDIRLNTGFYTSDFFNFFHHPLGTIAAKGSPLVHAASDLLTNRDYKGDKIFDSDEPWYKMAGDIAKYLGHSMEPLSVQQLVDTIQGGGAGKSLPMKLAGFAGVKTAPRSLSMSDAENAAHAILQGKQGVGGHSAGERAKSDLIRTLADERRDRDPDAQQDLQKAMKGGKITGKDLRAIEKRANQPAGLRGVLQSSELDARDLMEKVWPKMTPQERTENQWIVRGKIGRGNLSADEKQQFWNQIGRDVK